MDFLNVILLFTPLGAVVGILSGLFGIGGGLILVPAIMLCFEVLKISNEHSMHQAIASSLAIIFFNVSSSLFFHNKKEKLNKTIFLKLAIPTGIGSALGGIVSSFLEYETLKLVFTIYVTVVALKMLLTKIQENDQKQTPNLLYYIVGLIIGLKSSILGIGGGTISIPFLTWRGHRLKTAVSISAALGIPISLMGVLSYIITGQQVTNLAKYSIGYIYLPALIGCMIITPFSTKFGVYLSHSLPQKKLKKVFGIMLLLIALKSISSYFN